MKGAAERLGEYEAALLACAQHDALPAFRRMLAFAAENVAVTLERGAARQYFIDRAAEERRLALEEEAFA